MALSSKRYLTCVITTAGAANCRIFQPYVVGGYIIYNQSGNSLNWSYMRRSEKDKNRRTLPSATPLVRANFLANAVFLGKRTKILSAGSRIIPCRLGPYMNGYSVSIRPLTYSQDIHKLMAKRRQDVYAYNYLLRMLTGIVYIGQGLMRRSLYLFES